MDIFVNILKEIQCHLVPYAQRDVCARDIQRTEYAYIIILHNNISSTVYRTRAVNHKTVIKIITINPRTDGVLWVAFGDKIINNNNNNT